jgi:serine phosphatase RsbU (regulator of sigma subunit)
MLPSSERVDESGGQPWSQSGLASAQAASARSQESERGYEDFVRAAQSLVQRLRHREEQLAKLGKIIEQINLGLTLDEVLTFLYEELREVIPYNRIGVAFIEDGTGLVVANWSRSDRGVLIKRGYKAPLAASSLQTIAETGQPRIINDLEAYFIEHPHSKATQLILREGMQSSLTCPLASKGKPMGFVFLASAEKNTYSLLHVGFFEQIAAQLTVSVEKGRLYSELAEHKEAVERRNAAMTRDLEMARSVQQALIPHEGIEIPGLEIAFRYEPAIQVGGDMLDIIPLNDQKVLLFVGDAMGHGVHAALVMCAVRMAVHAAVQSDPRPETVLTRVNEVLVHLRVQSLVTAACCVVDSTGLHAELSLAGHAGPLWFRAETAQTVGQADGGLPLGVGEDTEYATTEIVLQPGDALVLFTDGIVEAFNDERRQYGKGRLTNQLIGCGRSSAEEICATIRRDFDAHCRSAPREDDLTLLVIKVPESQSRAPGSSSLATSSEAGKGCAEDAQADLDAIARMASEGGPNC